MKVFELLTPDNLKYKQLKSPVRQKWRGITKPSSARTYLSGGAFANVYDVENKPGSVEKIAQPHITSLDSDAYYQYLDFDLKE